MDNVATALVNNSVTIMLKDDKPLDEKAVTEVLSANKIKVTDTKKSDSLPF